MDLLSLRETLENRDRLRDNSPVIASRTGLMGGKQLASSDYELTIAKQQTNQEKFLSEMKVGVAHP